jgi:hypothetical protein
MKYQSLLNVYIKNIKELQDKSNSRKTEHDIAAKNYKDCLEKLFPFPQACENYKKILSGAEKGLFDSLRELRQAKEECDKFKNSLPANIKSNLIGDCK